MIELLEKINFCNYQRPDHNLGDIEGTVGCIILNSSIEVGSSFNRLIMGRHNSYDVRLEHIYSSNVQNRSVLFGFSERPNTYDFDRQQDIRIMAARILLLTNTPEQAMTMALDKDPYYATKPSRETDLSLID